MIAATEAFKIAAGYDSRPTAFETAAFIAATTDAGLLGWVSIPQCHDVSKKNVRLSG